MPAFSDHKTYFRLSDSRSEGRLRQSLIDPDYQSKVAKSRSAEPFPCVSGCPHRKKTGPLMNISPSFAGHAFSTEPDVRTTVLVIENDPQIASAIDDELGAQGYQVAHSGTVQSALDLIRTTHPSALLIDRGLGGEDGLQIVEVMRRQGDDTPVLLISGPASVEDRISGLKAGGDDYLVKPFDMRELSARVETLLRRRRVTRLSLGDLEMDLVARKVSCEGRPVALLPLEFKLLEYFMRRPDEVMTREMLLEKVWNSNKTFTNVVDVQIGRIRKKLDPTGARQFIVNIRGRGFKLNAEA